MFFLLLYFCRHEKRGGDAVSVADPGVVRRVHGLGSAGLRWHRAHWHLARQHLEARHSALQQRRRPLRSRVPVQS